MIARVIIVLILLGLIAAVAAPVALFRMEGETVLFALVFAVIVALLLSPGDGKERRRR